MTILFSMCVGDWHNYGEHTGKLRAAEFENEDGDSIHVDCTDREITCRKLDDKHIRIGRRKFPILSYRDYVGNMAWDAARVTQEVADAIVDLLRADGKYSPIDGATYLWERWEANEPLFTPPSTD
jgi:hypothetical protein